MYQTSIKFRRFRYVNDLHSRIFFISSMVKSPILIFHKLSFLYAKIPRGPKQKHALYRYKNRLQYSYNQITKMKDMLYIYYYDEFISHVTEERAVLCTDLDTHKMNKSNQIRCSKQQDSSSKLLFISSLCRNTSSLKNSFLFP